MTRNLRTALLSAAAVVGMTGVGFASVPLYRMFCQATGFNGTTQRGEQAPGERQAGRRGSGGEQEMATVHGRDLRDRWTRRRSRRPAR